MSISSASLARYTAIQPTMASKDASSAHTSDCAVQVSGAPQSSTVVTFSAKAQELLKMREVSDAEQDTFKNILQKAEAAHAQDDPKAFLRTLTSTEMDALQQAHSLAEPIDVNTLNDEGAANLLAQPGSTRDIDHNGVTSIGAGTFLSFPPDNAPESFKAAWASASAGKSFGDIPSQMILAIGINNIRADPVNGQPVMVAPDDPQWRNPYADPNYDYAGAVQRTMDALRDDRMHNRISEAKFKNDMDFYDRLSSAMGSASGA
jgi:hypothetical protein